LQCGGFSSALPHGWPNRNFFGAGDFGCSRKSLIYTIFCDTYHITDIFKAPSGRNKKQKRKQTSLIAVALSLQRNAAGLTFSARWLPLTFRLVQLLKALSARCACRQSQDRSGQPMPGSQCPFP